MQQVLFIVTLIILLPFLAWIVGLWALALRSLRPKPPPPATAETPFIAIVVPAHNEAEIIADTVGKILACDYPRDKFSLTVVADNCQDDTAGLAKKAGAIVLERIDSVKRGKGHALAYALEALRGERVDAVLFMDADSSPEGDYLRVMASYLERGDQMIQGRYEVNEPNRNWFTRLTSASFVLRNRWQFPACEVWGLTLPLRGSGMCFARALIYRLGWESHGLNEDLEMSLRLVRDKTPVAFAFRAVSRQFMPATPAMAKTQRQRWSAGEHNVRKILLRREIPDAVRRRDWRGAVSLALMAAPPFSLQLCLAVFLLLPGYFAGSLAWVFSLTVVALYAVYFFLGIERLDKLGLTAVAMLPVFALWRVGIYLAAAVKKPGEWIRTSRTDGTGGAGDKSGKGDLEK